MNCENGEKLVKNIFYDTPLFLRAIESDGTLNRRKNNPDIMKATITVIIFIFIFIYSFFFFSYHFSLDYALTFIKYRRKVIQ